MCKNTNNSEENTKNGRVVVINPNSTKAVTEGIDAALYPLRFRMGLNLIASLLKKALRALQLSVRSMMSWHPM